MEKIHFKVKIKTLAAEARIIRNEERKAKKWKDTDLLTSLANHRKRIVRYEARHNLIAYAFLRNKKYDQVEKKPKKEADWGKVAKIASRFSNNNVVKVETIKKWAGIA